MKALLQVVPRDLVLDLSEIRYLDSPAHGSLFEVYRFVTEPGGTMKVVGLQPRVSAMASLVVLTRAFEVFADEETALGHRPENEGNGLAHDRQRSSATTIGDPNARSG